MMKRFAATAFLLMVTASGAALAQDCPSGTVRVTGGSPSADGNGGDTGGGSGGGNFTNFISGARICAARNSDRWQEFHQNGGALFDWKLGLNHAVDPRKQVGTWNASNGNFANLTHSYGSSFNYTWVVCRPSPGPGPYTMVSSTAGTVIGVRIFPGDGACP